MTYRPTSALWQVSGPSRSHARQVGAFGVLLVVLDVIRMDAIYSDFGYVGEIQNLWLFPLAYCLGRPALNLKKGGYGGSLP